jgi:hypothetical protein
VCCLLGGCAACRLRLVASEHRVQMKSDEANVVRLRSFKQISSAVEPHSPRADEERRGGPRVHRALAAQEVQHAQEVTATPWSPGAARFLSSRGDTHGQSQHDASAGAAPAQQQHWLTSTAAAWETRSRGDTRMATHLPNPCSYPCRGMDMSTVSPSKVQRQPPRPLPCTNTSDWRLHTPPIHVQASTHSNSLILFALNSAPSSAPLHPLAPLCLPHTQSPSH